MADRISDILIAHVELAKRQLALVQEGVSFSELDLDGEIPITEQDLLKRIASMQNSLAKHQARQA